MQHQAQTPIVKIQDIVVVATRHKKRNPVGEFCDPTIFGGKKLKDTESADEVIDRLYNHIEELASYAAEKHRAMNCIANSNELKAYNRYNITRLVTNEFYFYTMKPLTLEQFASLQNKLFNLAKNFPDNLRLVLASFAVKTTDNKVMNVVAQIGCGKNPAFNFIVKNHSAKIDPIYVETQGNTKVPLLNIKSKNDNISLYQLNINDKPHFFSFINIFECQTAGGLRFIECVDICLDHFNGVVKKNIDTLLLKVYPIAKQYNNFDLIPILYSHVVVSNISQLRPYNCLGVTTQADPKYSFITCKEGIAADPPQSFKTATGKESTFGTPQEIFVTHSVALNAMNLLSRPAYLAIKHNYYDALNAFLKKGLDPNCTVIGTKSKTLLMAAIKYDQTEIVELLLKSGANPNLENINGHTPLYVAMKNNNSNLFNLLIDYGADPTRSNANGHTLLFYAFKGSLPNVEMLDTLMSIIDIDATDNMNQTELHRAALENNSDVIIELIDRRANTLIEDINGDTALQLAIRNGCISAALTIIEIDAVSSFEFYNKYGQTALHIAALTNNANVVAALIDRGVNPNIKNKDGCTALDLATEKNYQSVINILLKKGANPKQTINEYSVHTHFKKSPEKNVVEEHKEQKKGPVKD